VLFCEDEDAVNNWINFTLHYSNFKGHCLLSEVHLIHVTLWGSALFTFSLVVVHYTEIRINAVSVNMMIINHLKMERERTCRTKSV
jgi:hypothetical protein